MTVFHECVVEDATKYQDDLRAEQPSLASLSRGGLMDWELHLVSRQEWPRRMMQRKRMVVPRIDSAFLQIPLPDLQSATCRGSNAVARSFRSRCRCAGKYRNNPYAPVLLCEVSYSPLYCERPPSRGGGATSRPVVDCRSSPPVFSRRSAPMTSRAARSCIRVVCPQADWRCR